MISDQNLEKYACLQDIIKEHSLPFLPAKSLSRFRTVSKEWNKWIGSEFLAHIQTIHFKDISGLLCQCDGLDPFFISFNQGAYGIPSPEFRFLPEPVIIRTTSNGLVCCQNNFGEHDYYICNPVTKEWKVLPKPKWFHGLEAAISLAFKPSTLGFDASYELVCAVPVYLNEVAVVYFETYSSSTNSWKTSEAMCYENEILDPIGNGLYMKGIVYWKTLMDAILAFDLKSQQYGILPLPAGSGQDGALTQMHGEFCYMLPRIQGGECKISVYGNLDMSLKHVITLNPQVVGETLSDCQVLTCIDDDTLLILLPNKVIAYHVKTERVETLSEVSGMGYEHCLPYINTLAPVK